MDQFEWAHHDLCTIAVKWLQRPHSAKGHGCDVAVSEIRSGWDGEVPDAIGFRRKGIPQEDGSIVVEVKVSRADYLADRKKDHRQTGGLGNWRYFLCPEGLIQADELPPGWGLIWVTRRGHVKPQAGAATAIRSSGERRESLAAFRFDSDVTREQFILVRLLARVGDVEKVNRKIKEAVSEQHRLARRCDQKQKENEELTKDLHRVRRGEETSDEKWIREAFQGIPRG